MTPSKWTRDEAVFFAAQLEALAPQFQAHVALTGGCLYKMGERKDADFLFYRIRQAERIDTEGLMAAIRDRLGVTLGRDHGWVWKATLGDRKIDFFFPERPENEMPARRDDY